MSERKISIIYVLDEHGYLETTKFMKPVEALPNVGEKVVSFYEEEKEFYDAVLSISPKDNLIMTVGGLISSPDKMLKEIISDAAKLVNVVANSDFEDWTLQNRDGFSAVRMMEACVEKISELMEDDVQLSYEKKEYSEKEVIDLLNRMTFYIDQVKVFYIQGKLYGDWTPQTKVDDKRIDCLHVLKKMTQCILICSQMELKRTQHEKKMEQATEDWEKEDLENEFYQFVGRSYPSNLEQYLPLISVRYDKIKNDINYFGEKK